VIKLKRIRQKGDLASDSEGKEKCMQMFGEETRKKEPFRRQRIRKEVNIKMDLKEIWWGVTDKGTIGDLL
jgi:hypothetical protein